MNPGETDGTALRQLEESLLRDETRCDRDYVAKILASDFFEFGRSGRVYSREACVSASFQPIAVQLPLPDFRVQLLVPDVALVTYTSVATDQGVIQRARRSSIWSRTKDGWMLRFHQGTPCA